MSSVSRVSEVRKFVHAAVVMENLKIELPVGDWTTTSYPLGPLFTRLTLSDHALRFDFYLGKYDNTISGSSLAQEMASSIPAPGPRVRSSLEPQPTLQLEVDVEYYGGLSLQIVTAALIQTADLAIEVFKVGVATKALIDPTVEDLEHYGLVMPKSNKVKFASRYWDNDNCGYVFLAQTGAEFITDQEFDDELIELVVPEIETLNTGGVMHFDSSNPRSKPKRDWMQVSKQANSKLQQNKKKMAR